MSIGVSMVMLVAWVVAVVVSRLTLHVARLIDGGYRAEVGACSARWAGRSRHKRCKYWQRRTHGAPCIAILYLLFCSAASALTLLPPREVESSTARRRRERRLRRLQQRRRCRDTCVVGGEFKVLVRRKPLSAFQAFGICVAGSLLRCFVHLLDPVMLSTLLYSENRF